MAGATPGTVAFFVGDLDALAAFYGDTLSLAETVDDPPRHRELAAGGAGIGFAFAGAHALPNLMAEAGPSGLRTILTFRLDGADTLATTIDRAVAGGCVRAAGTPDDGEGCLNDGNAADMMRAMFATAGLFRDPRRDATLFSAYRVLATANGAAGTGLPAIVVSIEVGKKAGSVLHDGDRPLIDEEALYAGAGRAGAAVLARATMPVPSPWPVL